MTTTQSVATLLNGTVAEHVNRYNSKVTVVLGAQWGDEGKGKVVDMLATEVDIVCRCQVSYTFFFIIEVCHVCILKEFNKTYRVHFV